MPQFLFQGSYTAESIAALVQSQEDRSAHIHGVLEKLGGKLEGFWLAFGEHDFYVIAHLPDAQSAAAFALSATAAGGVHKFSTIPLLSWPEGIAALKQAKAISYRPPAKRAKA